MARLMNFLIVGWLFLGSGFAALAQESQATSVRSTATTNVQADTDAEPDQPTQQHYELRIYRQFDYEKQQLVEAYLESCLLPALKRQGIEQVGVFRRMDDPNDHSVYALIVYPDLDAFSNMNNKLGEDAEYQESAKPYFDQPLKEPVFTRIESRLMKAFAGMPMAEVPAQKQAGEDRIFELRLYQSHTEYHAAKKVEMFNKGEIQIMRDADMGPVFFGETLIGADCPNLIYMLSASDEDAHKQHWQAFLKHPDWKRMSGMEEYKDTVSKIENWFLKPTPFSDF